MTPNLNIQEIQLSDEEMMNSRCDDSTSGNGSTLDSGGNSGGFGSTSRSDKSGGSGDRQEDVYFAKRENSRVWRLKIIVFGILGAVALAVCLAVFFVTSNGQEDEMEAA